MAHGSTVPNRGPRFHGSTVEPWSQTVAHGSKVQPRNRGAKPWPTVPRFNRGTVETVNRTVSTVPRSRLESARRRPSPKSFIPGIRTRALGGEQQVGPDVAVEELVRKPPLSASAKRNLDSKMVVRSKQTESPFAPPVATFLSKVVRTRWHYLKHGGMSWHPDIYRAFHTGPSNCSNEHCMREINGSTASGTSQLTAAILCKTIPTGCTYTNMATWNESLGWLSIQTYHTLGLSQFSLQASSFLMQDFVDCQLLTD